LGDRGIRSFSWHHYKLLDVMSFPLYVSSLPLLDLVVQRKFLLRLVALAAPVIGNPEPIVRFC
jgi:hypothetical protein